MPDPVYEFIGGATGDARCLLKCHSCGAVVLSDETLADAIATRQWSSVMHTGWHRDQRRPGDG